jgi:threonine 3-dehydrogenase
MNALHKDEAAPGAAYGPFKEPGLKDDELLIDVHRASICGSDLPLYHWTSWAPQRVKPPMVFGHEFCGTVKKAGKAAAGFKVGDFVSVESHIYCGECRQCREGQKQVCRSMKIIGIDAPGGFGDLAAVPARCAWKHKDARLKDAGSLFEPFGNAVYAVTVEPVEGQTVLVLGCGPQGLFSVAVARASGAARVIAVEGSSYRAKLALKLGADKVIDPASSRALDEALKAGACPDGFDAACEMSGAPAAIAFAFKAVRNGGRISAFGIPPGDVSLDWANGLIFKGIRVHGIVGREIWDTWEKTDAFLRSGRIDIASTITHTFPLKDYKQGFAVMSSPDKKCGKVVFVP